MIPVRGHEGQRVAVLGLGRSGLATVRALAAGGADALAWDESAEARDKAAADGVALTDLGRVDWGGVAALIVSPGIPHLYPAPNRFVAAALEAGVPLDNDIGLFFRSLATPRLGRVRSGAAGRRGDGFQRKINDFGADPPSPAGSGGSLAAGREHRSRRARHRPAGGGRGGGAGAVVATRPNWRGR